MNILVTGASGLLGSNLCYNLSKSHSVTGIYNTNEIYLPNIETVKADITIESSINQIKNKKYDLIIHCAAIADMDFCEKNPDIAFACHVEGTATVTNLCTEDTKFVYISTDNVFDGLKKLYDESDATNPTNVYGQTKLKGERIVSDKLSNYLIVRTNIYGWNSHDNNHSFLEWIINTMRANDKINLFGDTFYSPISVNTLGQFILKASNKNLTGIYNISGKTQLSKHDFGQMVAETFDLDSVLIDKISIDDINLFANRPKNLALDSTKIQKHLGISLPSIKEDLELVRDLELNGFRANIKGIIV